jgi:hypothetical protein
MTNEPDNQDEAAPQSPDADVQTALPDEDLEALAEPTAAAAVEGGPPGASEVILGLARAARSFVTYDARNETVRRLISAYQQATYAALEAHGELVFEVHPFELFWRGEAVYSERDRERSLAFRLFRDGVRSMTIKPGVEWEELLKLLEILSIRYTGIRQQEDDTLTLLRQADFERIEFNAVEAYVPAEENPEADLEQQRSAQKVMPPLQWDLPAPRFSTAGQLQYRAITDEERAALLAEASDETLIKAACQVVDEVLNLATSQKNAPLTAQVLTLIEDICKFMIVELRPKELVWVVRETRVKLGEKTEGVDKLVEQFGCGDVIDRFLRDPDDVTAEAMMPLFSMTGGDHLDRVIERFTDEDDPDMRKALKHLLARLASGNPDALLSKLGTVPTTRVVDLFNVVCIVAPPERVIEAAFSLAEHESPEVQMGALEVLIMAPASTKLNETMEYLLASGKPRVRVKAAAIYGKKGGSRGFARLRDLLEHLAKEGLDPIEAEVLGKALMQASRETALPLMRHWVKPGLKGIMLRAKYGEGYQMLRRAGVAGLGEYPHKKSKALLSWLAAKSDGELKQLCERSLSRMEEI